MTPDEVPEFLRSQHFAAVSVIAGDGGPRVTPVRFSQDGSSIVFRPSSADTASRMTRADAEAFLRTYRYPNEHRTSPFVAVATLRKDGTSLVVPFGALYDDGVFFLSVNNART